MKLLDDLRAKRMHYGRDGSRWSWPRVILTDGTLANVLFRLQEALSAGRLDPIAYLVHWVNKRLTGCVIGVGTRFGPGFVLIHPIGVVINSAVRGGRNVLIESSVVIGRGRVGSPVLGDDVYLGSGAKLLGGIRIGSGVRVGANAVVLCDVPDGVTMVGVPARPAARRAADPDTRR